MKTKLLLAMLFVSVANLYGLMDWETTQVTQEADPLDSSVSATFKFENIGGSEVTITDIRSSCGCTTAELEQKTYAPGEKGEINAKFNIGSRQGLQIKRIRVTTNEGEQPTVLTMKTLIPKVLDIQPAFVFWKQGEVPDMKTIDLKVGLDEPMRIIKASSSNSAVEVQLKEVEAGKRYQLILFPTSTDSRTKARITLNTDYPKDNPKTFYVYAHVK